VAEIPGFLEWNCNTSSPSVQGLLEYNPHYYVVRITSPAQDIFRLYLDPTITEQILKVERPLGLVDCE
jgi:hypothetical protein